MLDKLDRGIERYVERHVPCQMSTEGRVLQRCIQYNILEVSDETAVCASVEVLDHSYKNSIFVCAYNLYKLKTY